MSGLEAYRERVLSALHAPVQSDAAFGELLPALVTLQHADADWLIAQLCSAEFSTEARAAIADCLLGPALRVATSDLLAAFSSDPRAFIATARKPGQADAAYAEVICAGTTMALGIAVSGSKTRRGDGRFRSVAKNPDAAWVQLAEVASETLDDMIEPNDLAAIRLFCERDPAADVAALWTPLRAKYPHVHLSVVYERTAPPTSKR